MSLAKELLTLQIRVFQLKKINLFIVSWRNEGRWCEYALEEKNNEEWTFNKEPAYSNWEETCAIPINYIKER